MLTESIGEKAQASATLFNIRCYYQYQRRFTVIVPEPDEQRRNS